MGSKLHWILAGIFGGFLAIVIIKLVFFPSASKPTSATLGRYKLELLKPTGQITLVLPAEPSEAGDAGEDYDRAIKSYKQNRQPILDICGRQQRIVTGSDKLTAQELAILQPIQDAIAAGARKRSMSYTFRLTPQKIEIPYQATEAEDFRNLARVPVILSYAHVAEGEQGYPKAQKCLFELFTMGYHLMAERARMDNILAGIGLQKDACELLRQLYGDKWPHRQQLQRVRQYLEGLDPLAVVYRQHYEQVIWRRRPSPGDAFNLAENHADRAVRAEAILALGVVKLTCRSRGDRRYARKLIDRALRSEDPIERAAAKCADELTERRLSRLLDTR